jgi:hypothetical protein
MARSRRLKRMANYVARKQKSNAEELHSKWRRIIHGWLMNLQLPSNFESLDLKLKLALVKPLFYRKDFAEQMILNREWIFPELHLYQNMILLSCPLESEVELVLRNILISCRLFDPDHQGEVYRNLGNLFKIASRRTQANARDAVEFDSFISYLFNFDVLPMSFQNSAAKTVIEHRIMFAETVWKFIPLIVASTKEYIEDIDAFSMNVERVWCMLKQPKFESESWEAITSRIVKATDWDFDSARITQSFKIIADTIFHLPETSKDLCYVIYCFVVFKLKDEEASELFEVIVEAFENTSMCDSNTQLLISSILVNLPGNVWKLGHMKYARRIKNASRTTHNDVLLAAYKGLPYSDFPSDCGQDILQGLQEDPESWIAVIGWFTSRRNCNFENETFYEQLRAVMKFCYETEFGGRQFYADMCETFSSVLEARKMASREDWSLMLNILVEDYFSNYVYVRLVLRIPVLDLGESKISYLTYLLLSERYFSPPLILALIRLAELTQQPEKLALGAFQDLNYVHRTQSFSRHLKYSQFLKYVYVLAKNAQTEGVHSQSLVFLSQVLKQWISRERKKPLDSDSVLKVIQLLIKTNLCTSDISREAFQSISQLIDLGLVNSCFELEDHFNLYLALLTLNPSLELESRIFHPQNSDSDTLQLGHFYHLHRTRGLGENDKAEFVNISEELFTQARWDGKDSRLKAKFISQIIVIVKQFHEELYFERCLSNIAKEISNDAMFLSVLRPRLLLTEAIRSKKFCAPVNPETRQFLLNFSAWFELPIDLSDEDSLAYSLLIRDEKQEITESVARLFGDGLLDEKLAVFVASLYFVRLNDDSLIEKFTVSLLVQLARLR